MDSNPASVLSTAMMRYIFYTLSRACSPVASSPGPTPFWRGIGPGKVSAVCVFTLGRTKKCAANQITVLKHVKLTCDSCSLRRVSTECVQSFTAPWQWETLVVFAMSQHFEFQLPKLSSCWLVANTTKVSHCHGAVNDCTHSVDTRRNEQLSHVSFTCFNTVIWLAAHFFVRPNVNTQTALTLPGPIPLQKGVGPGNEASSPANHHCGV